MRPSTIFSLLIPLVASQTQYLNSLLLTNSDLSCLADALRIPPSNFAGSLGSSPITILAPTNAAFEALAPSGPERFAIRNRDRSAVQALLSYHVLQGTYLLQNFTENPTTVRTVSNQSYTIVRAQTNFTGRGDSGLMFGGSINVVNVPQAVSIWRVWDMCWR
jgi:uncharacterized surface protein with fasciclin (FAS1) repeats